MTKILNVLKSFFFFFLSGLFNGVELVILHEFLNDHCFTLCKTSVLEARLVQQNVYHLWF